MGRSEKKYIFGIHDITLYCPKEGKVYGKLDCLEGSTFSFTRETIELTGGSATTPFAIAQGAATSELTFTPGEYPSFLFNVLTGGILKEGAQEFKANVFRIDDSKTADSFVEIKIDYSKVKYFSKFFVKVDGKDDFKVYGTSDIGQSVALPFSDDKLLISTEKFGEMGVTLKSADKGNDKSLVVSLNVGDSFSFDVFPENNENFSIVIGDVSHEPKEFGAILTAQKNDGQMFIVDVFRAKCTSGLPLNFNKAAFSNSEITCKAMFDPSKKGIAKFVSIAGAR
jgi:hypothetical protein